MESASQKIISLIEAILPLLKLSDYELCAYYHGFLEKSLAQLKKPHDTAKVAEEILNIYGGMATFSDTAIWKNGQVLFDAHQKFSDLRTALFFACEDALSEGMPFK